MSGTKRVSEGLHGYTLCRFYEPADAMANGECVTCPVQSSAYLPGYGSRTVECTSKCAWFATNEYNTVCDAVKAHGCCVPNIQYFCKDDPIGHCPGECPECKAEQEATP